MPSAAETNEGEETTAPDKVSFTLGGSSVFVLSNQSWARGIVDIARAATATPKEAISGRLQEALDAGGPVSVCSEHKAMRTIASIARNSRQEQFKGVRQVIAEHPALGFDPRKWSPTALVAYDMHLSDFRAALFFERFAAELWAGLLLSSGSSGAGPGDAFEGEGAGDGYEGHEGQVLSPGMRSRREAAHRARGRGVGREILRAPMGDVMPSIEGLC